MKRLFGLLLALCMALASIPCLAEGDFSASDYVSLPELSAQAAAGWNETFSAQGREVTVAVDVIRMPETDACPVLEIAGMGEGDVASGSLDRYQGVKGVTVYSFSSSLSVDYLAESIMAPGAKGSYAGKLANSQPYTEWFYGDAPTFQPENVDLTYEQYLQKIDTEIEPIFGLTLADFRIRRVTADGVEYMAKENKKGELILGKQFSRWGSFYLEAEQLFHGIPVVGYSGEWTVTPKGTLYFFYANAGYYHFTVSCSRETGVREADVPLLSLDAMKRVLTAQIESGHLRGVDELEFGYLAMYEGKRSEGRWLLAPVWRMHGGYTQNAKQEHVMPYYSERDGGEVVPQEYGDFYYSAQTGELLPTDILLQNGIDNPLQAGSLLTWADVGGKR